MRIPFLPPKWAKDKLWAKAREVPSLDLRFADSKSLVDATTGQNLVTFTRASSGTYVGADGLIKSAGTNEPRFDHNPTTGESLGLLVEEARTNNITNNTMVGAVAGTPGTLPTGWAYFAATTGLTASIVGTGIEGGISYIDLRLNGTASSASPSELGFNTAAAATGQTWTFGTHWRLAGGSTSGISSFELGQIELTSGGAFVAGVFVAQTAPTSGGLVIQRPAYTRTLSGGATVALVAPRIRITPVNGAAIDITLRIGMPQLEQGAFATSVIPTSGTAATRSADVASISGSNYSSWANSNEYTIFAEAVGGPIAPGASFPIIASFEGSTSAERIQFARYADGRGRASVASGGVVQSAFDLLPAWSENATGKMALSVKNDEVIGSVNGGALATDNTVLIPTLTQLRIGSTVASSQYYNGRIKRLVYWPQALPGQLQTITQ